MMTFVLGCFAGGIAAMFFMSLMIVAKRSDVSSERIFQDYKSR
ncbi:hypothetical protein ACFQPF_07295 [Fictibacillus iocasae]|uniref:DUF3789 domain-containing protein n=1 Tax=Fictibacillus iocasae TaxID=2715437 RepID=A0ABW2NS56_9BACL